MKNILKLSAVLALVGIGIVACTDDTNGDFVIFSGTYDSAMRGSGDVAGWKWDITDTTAKITCPIGTYVPQAIKDNTTASQDFNISSGSTVYATQFDIEEVFQTTDGRPIVGPKPLKRSNTFSLVNTANQITTICVPAADVNRLTPVQ